MTTERWTIRGALQPPLVFTGLDFRELNDAERAEWRRRLDEMAAIRRVLSTDSESESGAEQSSLSVSKKALRRADARESTTP